MKKKNNIKKEIKKIKKSKISNFKKGKKQEEVDLWKEIRTNVKPLVKAYYKFNERRKIAKRRKEEKKLKEEEESLRIQIEEEKRITKQKKKEEEKIRKLKAQEEQKLENQRIVDERDERIRQEQIYRERLIKGEEERIKLLARVNESREEERKLRDERYFRINDKFTEEQNLKDKDQKLKKEEKRLKEEEKRLKEEEQRLKEEEINLKKLRESEGEEKGKRLNGAVLWFNDNKGYGFIKREDKEKDIFVHISAVQNSGLDNLKKDEQLTFEVEDSDKGPSAVNLQKTVDELSRPHLKVVK